MRTKTLCPKCMQKERKKERKKKNEDIMHQNLWNTFKAVSREKFIPVSVHMRSEERSKIDTVTS